MSWPLEVGVKAGERNAQVLWQVGNHRTLVHGFKFSEPVRVKRVMVDLIPVAELDPKDQGVQRLSIEPIRELTLQAPPLVFAGVRIELLVDTERDTVFKIQVTIPP